MVRIREQLNDQEKKEPTRLSTLTPGCKVYIKRSVTRTLLSQKHVKDCQLGPTIQTSCESGKRGPKLIIAATGTEDDSYSPLILCEVNVYFLFIY
uniref:Uncharacterized protein n=1 Tax=Strongyloides venezuelensis TaxID=75913 RepID=A0A0K0FI10_STRVS